MTNHSVRKTTLVLCYSVTKLILVSGVCTKYTKLKKILHMVDSWYLIVLQSIFLFLNVWPLMFIRRSYGLWKNHMKRWSLRGRGNSFNIRWERRANLESNVEINFIISPRKQVNYLQSITDWGTLYLIRSKLYIYIYI